MGVSVSVWREIIRLKSCQGEEKGRKRNKGVRWRMQERSVDRITAGHVSVSHSPPCLLTAGSVGRDRHVKTFPV
jgi:hypothetical protein